MSDYQVLFDGTSDRPWGKMLFAQRSADRQPEPPRQLVWGEITALIRSKRDVMGHDWHTMAEVAQLIDRPVSAVMSPIGALATSGHMEREHAPVGRRFIGTVQRYRWKP